MKRFLTLLISLIPLTLLAQDNAIVLKTGVAAQTEFHKGGIGSDSLNAIPVIDSTRAKRYATGGAATVRVMGRAIVNTSDSNFYYHNGGKWVAHATVERLSDTSTALRAYTDSKFDEIVTDIENEHDSLVRYGDSGTVYVSKYGIDTAKNNIKALKVSYSDSTGFLPTKTFLLNNYFVNGGNSFGVDGDIGTKDAFPLKLRSNNTVRATIFSNGNVAIGTTTDGGYKLNVNGTLNVSGVITQQGGKIDIQGAAATDNIKIGTTNTIDPAASRNFTIGNSNINTGVSTYAITIGNGNNKAVNLTGDVSIGTFNTLTNGDNYSVTIGASNTINYSASSVQRGTVTIGYQNSMTHLSSAIIGGNQSTTESNQLIFAMTSDNSTTAGWNRVYFGTGPRSKNSDLLGSNVTLNASGAGNGTDKTGGLLRLAAGKSTGAATSPNVVIATATPTTSGTTLQTLTDRFYFMGGQATFSNTSSPVGTPLQYFQSTTQFTRPIPAMTQAQRDAITPQAWEKVICTDCTATDGSTGVEQTYNGSAWKNHW